MAERVQPVVLVGGRSRRFGRDKLREPLGHGVLVDRPIGALREVFGPCVAVVGDCDPAVARRGDLHVGDRQPGRGPAGGVLTALDEFGCAVFVLSGDLPNITGEHVRTVVRAAEANPNAPAVIALTTRTEPCIGVYRPGAAHVLRDALARDKPDLWRLIDQHRWPTATLPPEAAVNVNTPDALPGG